MTDQGINHGVRSIDPGKAKKAGGFIDKLLHFLAALGFSFLAFIVLLAIVGVASQFNVMAGYILTALIAAFGLYHVVRPSEAVVLRSRVANSIYILAALGCLGITSEAAEKDQERLDLIAEVQTAESFSEKEARDWLIAAERLGGGSSSDLYYDVLMKVRPDSYLEAMFKQKGPTDAYLEIVELNFPDRLEAEQARVTETQEEQAKIEAVAAAQKQAEAERKAAERAAAAQREADQKRNAELEEKRKGFHCLSAWDGSHRDLKAAVKRALRNPDSFEHIQTLITPRNADGLHRVTMQYRAQNGFGGMNVEYQVAMISNSTCSVVSYH